MPDYRATRCLNTREADTCHFTAQNDEEARQKLLSGDHPEWSGDADLIDCDFPDITLGLDRRNDKGGYDVVVDEIPLPDQKPYGAPARDFVLKVARHLLFAESGCVTDRPEGSDPEAAQKDLDWLIAQDETLESLITEARVICGLSQPAS